MCAAPRPLYMLPFDHRASFEHGLFGWTGALTAEQTAQVAGAKRVVYDGLLQAIADGVPADRTAVLVDEQFGRAILADARARGLTTACPAEASGQAELQFEYGDDFARHVEAMDPTYCKVLVRYNPEGDAALNQRQAARLRTLSDYLHRAGRRFLFELLVPAEPTQLALVDHDPDAYDRILRPPLVVRAMRALQDAGVEPDVWKVEGLDGRHDCLAVADVARRDGRAGVTCIVLGRHAEEARVRTWLEVAASVPAFVGFAVGRSTFWDPLHDLIAGRIPRPDAVAEISRTYRRWVDIWETARGERGARTVERAREIEVYPDGEALIRTEAERFVALAAEAIAARGRFAVALSGGSTPRPLYQRLATPPLAGRIDWSRVHVFWGDERAVGPDHPESNYRMTREALLDHVPIPAANVHRIVGEDDPDAAARAYERTLREFFATPDGPPARSFDLVLLGMGDDGHTASLFPGTPPVTEERRWVMANHVTGPKTAWRITLTPVVLNAAGAVTFLVAGADKAPRLRDVIEGGDEAPVLPAQRIQPSHGALTWMVDAAAAARLRRPPQGEHR